MKAQTLIAMALSVLFNVAGLIALAPRAASFGHDQAAPVSEIRGLRVIDLAPVQVTPSAEERHEAGLADAASFNALPDLAHEAKAGALRFGAQLAMPYYSFSNTLGRIVKD